MTNLDRKLQASAFVRRNSGMVAAELPHNQLAQLLHKSEQDDAAMEEIENVQNSIRLNQCHNADGPERCEPILVKEFCFSLWEFTADILQLGSRGSIQRIRTIGKNLAGVPGEACWIQRSG